MNTLTQSEASKPATMTLADVASELQCSMRTVRRGVDAGGIPSPLKVGTKCGALLRWRRRDIEAWLANGCPACSKAASRK